MTRSPAGRSEGQHQLLGRAPCATGLGQAADALPALLAAAGLNKPGRRA